MRRKTKIVRVLLMVPVVKCSLYPHGMRNRFRPDQARREEEGRGQSKQAKQKVKKKVGAKRLVKKKTWRNEKIDDLKKEGRDRPEGTEDESRRRSRPARRI